MKKIIIEVNTVTGERTYKTSGFSGAECMEAAAPFKEVFGGKGGKVTKTAEFHKATNNAQAGARAKNG